MLIAATGHRPNKLGGYDESAPLNRWVIEQLSRFLAVRKERYGSELEVISGLALGVDTWWAIQAMSLDIPVTGAVPFEGQEGVWPQGSQELYRSLRAKCKEIVVVSPGGYSAAKMQVRNQWMVDHCDGVLAVWDGTAGGTANCVGYARRVGKPIIQIDPKDFVS